MPNMVYEKPLIAEYGTITTLTKGDTFKKLGGGDGIFLISDDGPIGMTWVSAPSLG